MIFDRSLDLDRLEPLLFAANGEPLRGGFHSVANEATDLARVERRFLERDIRRCEDAWRAVYSELIQELQASSQPTNSSAPLATWMSDAVERHSLGSTKYFWNFFARLGDVSNTNVATKITFDMCTINTAITLATSAKVGSSALGLLSTAQGADSLGNVGRYSLLTSRDLKSVWSSVIQDLTIAELAVPTPSLLPSQADLIESALKFFADLYWRLMDKLVTKIEWRGARQAHGRSGNLTREQALSFAILIDLPPPFPVVVCPALSKQLIGRHLTTGRDNETPRECACRGGPSVNVRLRIGQARWVRGPSDDSPIDGCPQLARRRRNRSYRRVVQLPRQVRSENRWKMVPHFCVARSDRGRGDKTRAEVNRRCA